MDVLDIATFPHVRDGDVLWSVLVVRDSWPRQHTVLDVRVLLGVNPRFNELERVMREHHEICAIYKYFARTMSCHWSLQVSPMWTDPGRYFSARTSSTSSPSWQTTVTGRLSNQGASPDREKTRTSTNFGVLGDGDLLQIQCPQMELKKWITWGIPHGVAQQWWKDRYY